MGLLLLQGSSDLNPRELFANNEQGLWLDPSQMSTMFTDSAGTTSVTAAGDPVGLILDQSRGGLGAAVEKLSNGTFDTDATGWTAANGTTAVSNGKITITNTAAYGEIYQAFTTVIGRHYACSINLEAITGSGNLLFFIKSDSTSFSSPNRVDIIANGSAVIKQYSAFFVATATTTYIHAVNGSTGVGASVTVDNISVREVPGNHAYQTTSAARPTLQTSGGLWYLSFDGSDDSLVTNSVDFSATDEMTVIAGVRKLSDAARGTVCELTATSASNNGAFHLTAPNAASATYAFESKGTALTDAVASSVTAPLTSVISGSSDISGDSNVIRVNGSQSDSDTGDQGTGNYSNAILYIGRRGGSSLPYNGHLYQLIVRGKTTPTGKLLEAERFVGRKTGVSF